MKILSLKASRYRSLKSVETSFMGLNVFIGTNASGKSNLLDALRFLSEGVQARDFEESVLGRGGIVNLAWKGEAAGEIVLETLYEHEGQRYRWTVGLRRRGLDFATWEDLYALPEGQPPQHLLHSDQGKIWWWSSQAKDNHVRMTLSSTACALAVASADESFSARKIGEFIQRWGFFDPSPPMLRWTSPATGAERLDAHGRNLAARLHALKQSPGGETTFQRIQQATRRVLGVPDDIQLKQSESDGRLFFTQREAGLAYSVHQVSASSGTLRMLALMAALLGESGTSLVGIEEPENHIHPSALRAFAEYMREASGQVQIVITTHAPLLLDCLPEPEEVAIVRRTPNEGTRVEKEKSPQAVREALEASGFGLGEFYETKGFGA